MMRTIYQFKFAPTLPLGEVRDSLHLAEMAAEAVHGEADVLLDAQHEFNDDDRTCRIVGSTPAGRDLVRLFSNFLRREFGRDAFAVSAVSGELHGCAATTTVAA